MNHSRLYHSAIKRMRELREILKVKIRGAKFGEDLINFSTSCNGSLAQVVLAEQALEEWMEWAASRCDKIELLSAMDKKVQAATVPGKIRVLHSNLIIQASKEWCKPQAEIQPNGSFAETYEETIQPSDKYVM